MKHSYFNFLYLLCNFSIQISQQLQEEMYSFQSEYITA